MDSILKLKRFSDIDINDPFFDSLKEDYRGFVNWFTSYFKNMICQCKMEI